MQQQQQTKESEVVFSIWDMAGQEVYYATHQCFLSRNTLYLVVWSMEEGDKGIDYLKPWLLNIQVSPHPASLSGGRCRSGGFKVHLTLFYRLAPPTPL